MIAYFPTPYPDETMYSLLARFYIHSGYTSFTGIAKIVYKKTLLQPNVDFIDDYSDQVRPILKSFLSMNDLVMHHTMFPYFYRFVPNKKRVYDCMTDFVKCSYSSLPRSIVFPNRYKVLRYCPVCVSNDRKKYGETYWHCIHQVEGVDICWLHHCKLVDSSISVKYHTTSGLYTAEEMVIQSACAETENNVKYTSLVDYIMNVSHMDFKWEANMSIGEIIHSRLYNSKYISKETNEHSLIKLSEDLNLYYSEIFKGIAFDREKLQTILTASSLHILDACLLGFFLDIPYSELTDPSLSHSISYKSFDNMIIELYRNNCTFRQIAERLDSTYDYVFNVCLNDPTNELFKFRFDKARFG